MTNSNSADNYSIKENSFIARIAAWKLGAESVAIVLGKTIYLHNTSTVEFLQNEQWVRHELCHIRQFREHGFVPFIFKYLLESLKHGYYNNKFEMEARAAENPAEHHNIH
jgi:hypothetical protein